MCSCRCHANRATRRGAALLGPDRPLTTAPASRLPGRPHRAFPRPCELGAQEVQAGATGGHVRAAARGGSPAPHWPQPQAGRLALQCPPSARPRETRVCPGDAQGGQWVRVPRRPLEDLRGLLKRPAASPQMPGNVALWWRSRTPVCQDQPLASDHQVPILVDANDRLLFQRSLEANWRTPRGCFLCSRGPGVVWGLVRGRPRQVGQYPAVASDHQVPILVHAGLASPPSRPARPRRRAPPSARRYGRGYSSSKPGNAVSRFSS